MNNVNNRDLSTFILKWLYTRKNNPLISKSMLPKLQAFQHLDKTDVLEEIDALTQMGYINLNQLTQGPAGIGLISITQRGESFLHQQHPTANRSTFEYAKASEDRTTLLQYGKAQPTM
ncbi:MAG: hypothetical protein ACRCWR_08455 [Saezia sp.]